MRAFIVGILILNAALPVCAQTVSSCASITDDVARLKCYDDAVKSKPQEPQKTAGGWNIVTFTDRLDASKTFIAARSSAPPFPQGNGSVSTILEVSCYTPFNSKPELVAWLKFSSTVAVGERMVRWRVDQKTVHYHKGPFYSDGTSYPLAIGDDTTIADLRNGNTLKVEADLPWAGNVLLEFNVMGGAEAFTKLKCSNKR